MFNARIHGAVVVGFVLVSLSAAAGQPTTRPTDEPLRVMRAGKWGYINLRGEMVIPAKFKVAQDFSEGLAGATLDGRKWGYIDRKGEWAIEPMSISMCSQFSDGIASVSDGGRSAKYGLLTRTGRWLAEPSYPIALGFREGLCSVPAEDGKRGYIDVTGKMVIPPTFTGAGPFRNGLAIVQKGPLYGMIDKTGKTVVDFKFDNLQPFSDGLAVAFKSMQKVGYIDTKGNWVLQPNFQAAGDFVDGVAPVALGDGWRYINKAGKQALPGVFFNATPFSNGLAGVSVNGQWGFIDRTGKMVIAPRPGRRVEGFEADGLARVWAERGYHGGLIDRKGAWVVPPALGTRQIRVHGLHVVTPPGHCGYLTPSREIVGIQVALEELRSVEKLDDALVSAAPAAPTGDRLAVTLTVDNSGGEEFPLSWAGLLADAEGSCRYVDLVDSSGGFFLNVKEKQKVDLKLTVKQMPASAGNDARLLVLVANIHWHGRAWLKPGAQAAPDKPVRPGVDEF